MEPAGAMRHARPQDKASQSTAPRQTYRYIPPPAASTSLKGSNDFTRTIVSQKQPAHGANNGPDEEPASKPTRGPSGSGRQLSPTSNRKTGGENHLTKRRHNSSVDQAEIASDGTSAGREGRKFMVSNVGNNGKIYLRPSVRPAHMRAPQPNFTFPVTPPDTAGLDHETQTPARIDHHQVEPKFPTLTPEPGSSPLSSYHITQSDHWSIHHPPPRRRALSDSTIHDVSNAIESDSGALRIIISKPGSENWSRTVEGGYRNVAPVLDVDIPSGRIGRPQFTARGMILRGSSYAPTEEFYSPSEVGGHSNQTVSQSPQPGLEKVSTPNLLQPFRSNYLPPPVPIGPPMFDTLTFKPVCDDRTIVRYSSTTGSVTAATPPRLVAEITSPSFLDYELISDFFLTFRSYLDPKELLQMLFARLRWAVERADEIGMIVRVRAFVAMRHWILNYFVSDFVVDHGLRVLFCDILNQDMSEIRQDPRTTKKDLHIFGELKKCWSRTCGQYWDGLAFEEKTDMSVPLTPGGIAGHRNPRLDPSFWGEDGENAPRLADFAPDRRPTANASTFYSDVLQAGRLSERAAGSSPGTPVQLLTAENARQEFGLDSPMTMSSIDVVSCSFPSKSTRVNGANRHHPLAVHPSSSTPTRSLHESRATTPRAFSGKRVRPPPIPNNPKANITTIRDGITETARHGDPELLMIRPNAGNLLKGRMLPPAQPFVDISPELSGHRQTTIFEPQVTDVVQEGEPPGAMSGRGMRKLIDSVRRALGSRTPGFDSNSDVPAPWPRGITTNRVPGTSVVPHDHQNLKAYQKTRIDLLAAEVSEDFRNAIRREALIDAKTLGPFAQDDMLLPIKRPMSDTNLSIGSKSIVIVDDTVQFSQKTKLQHSEHSSAHSIGEHLVSKHNNLTPPNTPPLKLYDDVTRQSSRPCQEPPLSPQISMKDDPSPSLTEDSISGSAMKHDPAERHKREPSSRSTISRAYPPHSLSSKMHRRALSTRTQQSLDSIIEQHVPSIRSNSILRHGSVRSFDTIRSTDSLYRVNEDSAMPPPLRILRRRPGGDLKQITNIEELNRRAPRRSHSAESFSMYSESIASHRMLNYFPDPYDSHGPISHSPRGKSHIPSSERQVEKPQAYQGTFYRHHSTRGVGQPFSGNTGSTEANDLAQIPDDDNDDGGIESALLKLEGKFDTKPTEPLENRQQINDGMSPTSQQKIGIALGDPEENNPQDRQLDTAQLGYSDEDNGTEPSPGSLKAAQPRSNTGIQSFLSEVSEETRSSKPLLQDSMTSASRGIKMSSEWTDKSIFNAESDEDDDGVKLDRKRNRRHISRPIESTISFEFIHRADSAVIPRTKHGLNSTAGEQSFLKDDSDNDDDRIMSSSPLSRGRRVNTDDLMTYHKASPNLGSTVLPNSSKSGSSLEMGNSPRQHTNQLWAGGNNKALSPIHSEFPESDQDSGNEASTTQDAQPFRRYSVHLPFILAFSSEILAQQFTLIEKDALNEIDWKELIDMRWKSAPISNSRSWVEFLRNSDARGVEVVIARFNIMVKWAVSEVLLTKQVEERASCIIKLIHVAAQCRALRNFATLAQLTIALSSSEIARLARTWNLVPANDLKTLKSLEALVTPTRNFYNLRVEMECGGDVGCIPFVGIYTHDLLVNGQRPAEIASSPHTPPLVHFERCRVAAAVVKTLLRLIEASSKYELKPVEGIIERCLWMGTLADDEIRALSDGLD